MTKKISTIIGLSVSAIFFAQDVSTIRNTTEIYGNNYNETGSARYTAMGGSMGALGGDISTLNSNPAGLGVFILGEVSGSLVFNSDKNISTMANSSTSQSNNKVNIGQVGGVVSFSSSGNSAWKFINVGFAYNSQKLDQSIVSPGNPNIKKPYIPNGSTTPTDYDVLGAHRYQRMGNRTKLNFNLGGNFENKIYVGAGVNLSSVDVEQYDDLRIYSENTPSKSGYYRRNNTPFRESSSGFSLSIGVIGKLGNSIRLGAAIESPTWWNIEREYNYYELSSTSNIFRSYTGTEDRKLSTPTKLTLSGAVVPNKNFAFNVDYRLDLGKPSFSGGIAENQLNNFYNSTYKAQQEVRLGAEYRNKGFSVRGGYAFTTSPFKNYTYNYTAGSGQGVFDNNGNIISSGSLSNYIVGKSSTISAGIGYDFKSFFIDATYQHTTRNYSNPFYDGLYVHQDTPSSSFNESYVSAVSDVKTTRGNIILTLGWKF